MTRPNILLLVIDCLRADYAHDRSLSHTPTLGTIIGQGFSFRQAIAAANSTTPSFAAMLTGLHPFANGVRTLHGVKLSPAVRTLPEMLAEVGYSTYAEVSGGPLLPETGLNRGFASYTHRLRQNRAEQLATSLNHKINCEFRGPWFLMLHLWDLHVPRWIAPSCRERACGSSEYARSLSSIDAVLAPFLAALPQDTILALTADHGEDVATGPVDKLRRSLLRKALTSKLSWSLSKRGYIRNVSCLLRGRVDGHAYGLYDELVRVPLIFHCPGRIPPGISDRQVRHVDVCPTILELAGLPVPRGISGTSLADAMRGEPGCHLDAYMEVGVYRHRMRIAALRVDNRYKLICGLPGERFDPELYDLQDDPGEHRNLAQERPELLQQLQARLSALQAQTVEETPMTSQEDAIVKERLRALGYM
ncbi:MAG TPA: sulfatase-like hydrolase/transferase [Planctomycetota bacterium]|nr:sulfatase-like hydrolase/transferase [Planctomycetota bacterium]